MLMVREDVQGWVMTGDPWPGSLTSFMRGRPDNSWRNIKARPCPPSTYPACMHLCRAAAALIIRLDDQYGCSSAQVTASQFEG